MNMIRKGQVRGVEKGDIGAQVKFVAQVLESLHSYIPLEQFFCPQQIFASQPTTFAYKPVSFQQARGSFCRT